MHGRRTGRSGCGPTGRPHRGFDWYLGVCPTHEGYLAAKIARLRRVVVALAPDGLFLSFTRYPGFWENWVPGYAFGDADRYCFCERCRASFSADLGLDLPGADVATQARFILEQHGEYALLRVRLETGRTHQIRVHLAAIGLPVVGDPVYGVPDPALGRQFLHAARLAFTHPFTGERVEVESPLPLELARYLDEIR